MTAYNSTGLYTDWDNINTWLPTGVPGTGDDVTIKNGHTVRIDSGTGNEAVRKCTIELGGELIIATESTQAVKLTIDDSASGGLDVQTGGSLTMTGDDTYRAEIDFAGNTNKVVFNLNGNIALDYADIDTVYPQNDRIDIDGIVGSFFFTTITSPSTQRIYMYGKATSITRYRTEFTNFYYALQNDNYDFVFTTDPNDVIPVPGLIRSHDPVIGRKYGRSSVVGAVMAVIVNGVFVGSANRWLVEDLILMMQSLESFTFTGPEIAMADVDFEVKPNPKRGQPLNKYYTMNIVQRR